MEKPPPLVYIKGQVSGSGVTVRASLSGPPTAIHAATDTGSPTQADFATLLVVTLMIPGLASAGDAGKGCSFQGTWFGVQSPEDARLTGWMVTVAGQSSNGGTNNLEYPGYDTTLGGAFPAAVRLSTLRGAWQRTGGNTFAYTMTGIAVDANNLPVWFGKLTGNITLSSDCATETITGRLDVFVPGMTGYESPFDGTPVVTAPLPEHYGRRVYLDLP